MCAQSLEEVVAVTERWGLEGWAGVDGHLWQEPPEGWVVQVSVGEPGGRWAGPGNVQGRGGGQVRLLNKEEARGPSSFPCARLSWKPCL